jgi:alkyl hydroperoxide reductase subunit AhpC
MPLNLGDTVPNFEADTTAGKIKFHDFIGESWTILFSHPSDYTPVCTTELGQVQKLIPEFQARGVKVSLPLPPSTHTFFILSIVAAQLSLLLRLRAIFL